MLLRNIIICRVPLYPVGEWAAQMVPSLLGLRPTQIGPLKDDRVGRALDRLFEADQSAMLTELVVVIFGHNKDHRPDLEQLLWIPTVSEDGAVPVHFKVADGNTQDSTTHIETWEVLRLLVGDPNFLYVPDSKLCSRENLSHIHEEGGRFSASFEPARSSMC